jgi:hypothetical protein
LRRGPNLLNYGMGWESAERAYVAFEADEEARALLAGVSAKFDAILIRTRALRDALSAEPISST